MASVVIRDVLISSLIMLPVCGKMEALQQAGKQVMADTQIEI
jgi:hypothetical protein